MGAGTQVTFHRRTGRVCTDAQVYLHIWTCTGDDLGITVLAINCQLPRRLLDIIALVPSVDLY